MFLVWQRPEEINYDTLSQNISGAIVRVHSGAQTSKENDAAFVNGVDKAFKTHITEFQKRKCPSWCLCLFSWKKCPRNGKSR